MSLAGDMVPEEGEGTPEQSSARYATVLYDYEGESLEELTLRVGDRILVQLERPSGWWIGRITDSDGTERTGQFPINFVRFEGDDKGRAGVAGATPLGAKRTTPPVRDENACSSAFLSNYRDRKFRMILRLCMLACIGCSFGTGMVQSSYTDYSEFQALVGIGVLIFIYVIGVIAAYVLNIEAHVDTFLCIKKRPVNFIEFFCDTTTALMLFGAIIAAVNRSRSLDNTRNVKIAGVFAMFTFMLSLASAIVSWRLYAEWGVRLGSGSQLNSKTADSNAQLHSIE